MIRWQVLVITNNEVTTLSPLANAASLHTVYGRENQLQSLNGIEANTALRPLDVRGNGAVTNLEPLTGLVALRSLGVGGAAGAVDLAPLAGLHAMAAMRLENFGGGLDLTPLDGLPYLATLSLKGTPLTNAQLETLGGGFTALRDLDISSSGVTSLADVVGVASLKILRASDNGISGLPDAALWSSVEDLRVGDNPLDTLAPLAGVLSLRRLDAPRTTIESVAALIEIPGFGAESFLDVRETLLAEDDCAALGVLDARGVDVRVDVTCGR